jgi:hypothetical protein
MPLDARLEVREPGARARDHRAGFRVATRPWIQLDLPACGNGIGHAQQSDVDKVKAAIDGFQPLNCPAQRGVLAQGQVRADLRRVVAQG